MTSHPEWNRNTSALEVARVFSERIKGRNVVLTGIAPNGVGEATALAFASQDPGILILVSRTAEKLKRTAEMIMKLYPRVNVNTMVMDLSSQAAIRKTAEEITQSVNKIDILINNAGVNSHHHKWTEEKIEYQFGVNHLGPFLLTNLLMPLILKAAEESTPGATRIITLTSLAHRLSPVRFTDYNFEGKPLIKEEEPFAHLPPTFTLPPAFCRETDPGYVPMVAYAQSKTASILFTRYLKDHLSLAGVTSVAVNPGGNFSSSMFVLL
ncbi:short-chain dehydrogenase/reductase family oxidoreductase [Colletotrichum tofieldiae]|nr:short-chain dehydrogenase/reductase family oxidoreductase [Colletotrichum tofieldiae]GKT96559.1 short-chain dehydrogenase/reductase family oxidoreductase [Colletotrichum tofieldiae]